MELGVARLGCLGQSAGWGPALGGRVVCFVGVGVCVGGVVFSVAGADRRGRRGEGLGLGVSGLCRQARWTPRAGRFPVALAGASLRYEQDKNLTIVKN